MCAILNQVVMCSAEGAPAFVSVLGFFLITEFSKLGRMMNMEGALLVLLLVLLALWFGVGVPVVGVGVCFGLVTCSYIA